MAYPLPIKSAVSASAIICNADSDAGFVSKSDVLEIIGRQRAAFEYLNVAGGLSPDSACRYTRERFEIVAGKLMALDSVRNLVCQILPKNAGDLMAEKPSALQSVDLAAVLAVVDRRRLDSHQSSCFHARQLVTSEIGTPVGSGFTKAIAIESAMQELAAELAEKFTGNAEEQPVRREESGPSIGEIPVTTAPANPASEKSFPGVSRNFLDWCGLNVDGLTSKELAALSELALDELETRGAAERWQTAV